MKIYAGARQSGKTTEAIRYCLENKYTLVVPFGFQVATLERENEGLKCISFSQFSSGNTKRQHERYVIDEVERCLSLRLGVTIEAITSLGKAVNLVSQLDEESILEQKNLMSKEEFKRNFPGVNL